MTLKHLISPEKRRKKLGELLKTKKLIRGIEAHNALSALIANDLQIEKKEGFNTKINEFDFFWESSLTDSASKGLPDIEMISFDSRLRTISEIFEVTDKPMIIDGDTGGDIHHFEYLIPRLEKLGVSAIIIEDKVFPKRNSLEPGVSQNQEDADKFANKIRCGKQIQSSEEFMIIARIESLIAGKSVEEALVRAEKYLKAGVDGIMIHSKDKNPEKILEFAKRYDELCKRLNLKKPLVAVPTTYNSIYESELSEHGFNIVIHANHLLRASYKAMEKVGKMILENERSLESDSEITPIKTIFEKVGFLDIKEKDKLLSIIPEVIITAAGENPSEFKYLGDLPKPLLKINNKSILEHQIDLFKKLGMGVVNVLVGFQKEKFNISDVNYVYNPEYLSTKVLNSLMRARDRMEKGFILTNSDLLFDEKLINELTERKEDIVIVVDNSYLYHKHEIDKKLDAVITKNGKQPAYQKLREFEDEVVSISKDIPRGDMTHEFVGLAKFSKKGAEDLIKVYDELKESHVGRFHGAESFEKAQDIDILQELIDRKFKISVHETNGGWIEIHTKKDLDFAREILKS
jgi:phosphoenolpyruvate mutase